MTTQTESADARPLTDAEKAIHKAYVAILEQRGFCRIDDPTSNRIKVFNRLAGAADAIRSVEYLEADFYRWLALSRTECEKVSVRYVLNRLKLIVGTKFVPDAPAFYLDGTTGFEYANTYRRYRPSSTSATISPLLSDLFERLAPDETARTILLQWLGHLFQRPGERPSWHIMLPSVPGTGKGFLVESILTPLLYRTMVARSFGAITGKFSSVLEDSLLILLDDCKSTSDSTQTQLKSILSEERQYIEKKHMQGEMKPTYSRFILASNEERPLPLEEGERRWYVLPRVLHRHDRFETQQLIAQLADWLKQPGSLDSVYNWFMSIDLAGFDPKSAPHSPELDRLIAMSTNPYAEALSQFAETTPVFSYSELVAHLKEVGLSKPCDRHLAHLIREAGLETARPTVSGRKLSVYAPKGMPMPDVVRSLETARAF